MKKEAIEKDRFEEIVGIHKEKKATGEVESEKIAKKGDEVEPL